MVPFLLVCKAIVKGVFSLFTGVDEECHPPVVEHRVFHGTKVIYLGLKWGKSRSRIFQCSWPPIRLVKLLMEGRDPIAPISGDIGWKAGDMDASKLRNSCICVYNAGI